MATLALAAAGSSIGGAVGGSILGVSTAVIGQAVGATIGRTLDARLLSGGGTTRREGPRQDSLDVMTSEEGAGVPDVYGRTAIAGEVIWASRMEEVASTTSVGGGKGSAPSQEVTEYTYFASFAVAVGEGEIVHFGRMWADGDLLDTTDLVIRTYPGTETQAVDPLIAAIEGEAPAFLGVSYVVFERLPLARYGNRLPQIRVEVWGKSGVLENLIEGVDIIPGSTEWGYMPAVVRRQTRSTAGGVVSEDPENSNRYSGVSDWTVSMDMLEATLPQVSTCALVVGWFGTDLRAGQCEIKPKVERADKSTSTEWSAAGLTRSTAEVVSTKSGRPAFGSTPADVSIIEAIKDLNARGQRVVLYPFILMDIAASQGLPHPSGTGTQGDYPWRGRIVPDAGEAVADEVSAFLGTASVSDFSVSGETVGYTGPAEWSFRRFILHLAHLAKAAGGVDAILIGTEMVGMTTATDVAGVYPFVDGLVALAADVAAVLPGSEISYAADWSEYHSHRPSTGDVYFHLDPLWSSPSIDFVSIDNYLPLSDWRSGRDHLDYDQALGHTSIYSLDYLKANVEGGEYWDWFYAAPADRETQTRTAITDGAYGEPWVFRNKAIREWQANAHHNRPAGVREASSTAWVAGSKRVWFTELGCPAITFGSNQPNVFFAQGSSESAQPHFSEGFRDDFMMRQYIRATIEWWRDNGSGIVDPSDILIWSWDARPWPEFPLQTGVWADGPDWQLGHWLNGRVGTAPAAEVLSHRLSSVHGVAAADIDVTAAYGQADGYAVPGPAGFRDVMAPFETIFRLDAVEDGATIRIASRIAAVDIGTIAPHDMVAMERSGGPVAEYTATRGALDDVAERVILRFRDGSADYDSAAVDASIPLVGADGTADVETPLVLDFARAHQAVQAIARVPLDGREKVEFSMPLSRVDIQPGRTFTLVKAEGLSEGYLIGRVTEGSYLKVEATGYAEAALAPSGGVARPLFSRPAPGSSVVDVVFLDLPLLLDPYADDWPGYVAAHADPWPVGADLYRSRDEDTGFRFNASLRFRATVGETLTPLAWHRPFVWADGELEVEIWSGALVTRPEADVVDGLNAIAVEHPSGWEILQFRTAELIGARTYRLSGLVRGQRGTAPLMTSTLPAGARIVLLDTGVEQVNMRPSDLGTLFWWKYGPTGGDIADFTSAQAAFTGVGRRPFAPVHVRVRPHPDGTEVAWIRQTRIEGDIWPDAGDVPLGEASEAYRVRIVASGVVLREVEVASASYVYTAAQQSSDGVSTPYEIHVAQISETYGPGHEAVLTVTI